MDIFLNIQKFILWFFDINKSISSMSDDFDDLDLKAESNVGTKQFPHQTTVQHHGSVDLFAFVSFQPFLEQKNHPFLYKMNKEINRLHLSRKWFETESAKSKRKVMYLSQLCFSLEVKNFIENNQKMEELKMARKQKLVGNQKKRTHYEHHIRKMEKAEKQANYLRWEVADIKFRNAIALTKQLLTFTENSANQRELTHQERSFYNYYKGIVGGQAQPKQSSIKSMKQTKNSSKGDFFQVPQSSKFGLTSIQPRMAKHSSLTESKIEVNEDIDESKNKNFRSRIVENLGQRQEGKFIEPKPNQILSSKKETDEIFHRSNKFKPELGSFLKSKRSSSSYLKDHHSVTTDSDLLKSKIPFS